MAVFSVTDRATFRRCRRMWDYASNSRQNLTGIGSGPEPLELGSLVHRALADWILSYTSESDADKYEPTYLSQLFLKHASQRQKEITEAYEEKTHKKITPQHLEPLHNVVRLGTHMMVNYQAYHSTPIPDHMTFAVAEQEVLIPVPGTEHRCNKCFDIAYANNTLTVLFADHITLTNNIKFPARPDCEDCNGTGVVYHYLSATLDGLIQDRAGILYVLEHKTYENRPQLADLNMNDQFTGYAWVVKQLNIGRIGGIAYDGMWKREKPPKYMQKEKRPGTMDDLFIRKILPKRTSELNEWGIQLAKEINEMANNPVIYPNVPWQGCSDCSFRDICVMQMKGEDPSHLIRSRYTQREVIRGGRQAQ